ncbi:MAG TPA: hemolysin family protein [Spirochaetota bacterium]|nr:hemolysin family protein [Spirochaetota bacterium]HOS33756.1 hemolysin family protein [Spirochaetota bacterium]HOS56759.1 hemolysin family protein [Spirochaetota bacterium]HPK62515.1 hemolysin family protein [Spirochaetota bacterium]HQF79011.1 hemolysin family protein [Spirochaetota bacterium]
MFAIYFIPFLIILFIFMQSFFSNSEMAMVSSNRIKLDYLSKNGDKRAAIILALLNNPERLFGTTLVGINIATVVSTALADYFFKVVIIDKLSFILQIIEIDLIISLVMVPTILVFGELFPMSIARKYPNTTALRNAKFIKTAYFVLFPLMFTVSRISKFIGKALKIDKEGNSISKDELELLVVGRFENISDETKKIINEVFDISELTAEDIMVHINEVVAINETSTVGDFKEVIKTADFSRYPVYRENVFNISSTISVINILGADDTDAITSYTEKLYIVPSTKPVIQILSELKRNRKYMGIVVDEFGVTRGILTIDNIVEEIIGGIKGFYPESSESEALIEQNIFDAKTYLDDFLEKTGIDFTDEEAETLGGLINIALGRIGRKGEKVVYKNVSFEIIEASDRTVKLVKLLDKQ